VGGGGCDQPYLVKNHNRFNVNIITLVALLPFTLKCNFLRQKTKKVWKSKYFTMQKHNLQKNPLTKKNPKPKIQNPKSKILQDIRTLRTTNLKSQHKPKYELSKILIEN
jgi:hypothetical protein